MALLLPTNSRGGSASRSDARRASFSLCSWRTWQARSTILQIWSAWKGFSM